MMETTSSGKILILFDIDGTLLDMHGAGRRAFIRALKTTFGWDDDLEYIHFSGTTDMAVFHRVLQERGLPYRDEEARLFFEQLPEELRRTVAGQQTRLYPGTRELLEFLSEHPRAVAGLVTGNIESCARIKLESADLHGHFTLGAFGHEHADRNEIARLAMVRATRQLIPGESFARLFLIGDTPSDVRAAQHIGATSIAVATGTPSIETLRDAGADYVLEDLSDLSLLQSILGISGDR